jgi:glyoxylase-like metal-dependent hydrolase (beta-lactamase superfamily II)
MLHHEPTRTLFAGDAILAGIPPLRFIERPRLAMREYSYDVGACHAAVRAFVAELPPTDIVASGHGPAIAEGVAEKLSRLR